MAGSTYYICSTQCLLALAKSEHEFSRDYDPFAKGPGVETEQQK